MKTCSICGIEYQPVTEDEHNGIHALPTYLDLGEGVTPEDVEKFREYWHRAVVASGVGEAMATIGHAPTVRSDGTVTFWPWQDYER